MYEEFHGFFPVFGREGGVLYAGRVVGDGANDAAFGFAVAREVDTAGAWRGVFCVDEAVKGCISLCPKAQEGAKGAYWYGALNLPAVVSR